MFSFNSALPGPVASPLVRLQQFLTHINHPTFASASAFHYQFTPSTQENAIFMCDTKVAIMGHNLYLVQ